VQASTWCDDAHAPQRLRGHKGIVQACARAESLIRAHLDGSSSELSRIAPRLVDYRFGRLWQPLPLLDAFHDYDAECFLSAREYVAPTFRELRNVCNLAQVRAAVPLRLVTLDGDKTLYPDRTTLQKESPLVALLFQLIERGVVVAMVTAVGFDSVEPYEARLEGLLDAIKQAGAPADLCGRLFVVGGQCNYLARCVPGEAKLQMVPPSEWQLAAMSSWDEKSVVELLDLAGNELLAGAAKLHMRDKVKLVRKARAVGILYLPDEVHRTTSLMLDEIAMGARAAVTRLGKTRKRETRLPFCTFNGGKDVFVDIGSKDLGIAALQQLVDATPRDTLHIGDQFSITGNDLLARRACGTLWVDNPEETAVLLTYMLRMLDHTKGVVRVGRH
jgi:IMP and pyridine-specific 5'-nucleotidase|tara:strand:+ start:32 stop:1195 length:1164 start_codon:yes stop_codon:yes gene_type:complete